MKGHGTWLHETRDCHGFLYFHMFFAAVHRFQSARFRRYRSESADRADSVFRFHARGKDRSFNRVFQWITGRYLFWFYALLYMYIGYANGKFSAIFYPEDIKLPITLILCSDFAYGIICYMILFLLRGKFDFQYYLVHIILPEIVYTVVVTLFLYPVILRVNRSLEQKEKRGEKKFV